MGRCDRFWRAFCWLHSDIENRVGTKLTLKLSIYPPELTLFLLFLLKRLSTVSPLVISFGNWMLDLNFICLFNRLKATFVGPNYIEIWLFEIRLKYICLRVFSSFVSCTFCFKRRWRKKHPCIVNCGTIFFLDKRCIFLEIWNYSLCVRFF